MENVLVLKNEELRTQAHLFLDEAYKFYNMNKLRESLEMFVKANKVFTSMRDIENISISLSWMSFLNYHLNSNTYYKIIIMLNDAKFLAENCNSSLALFNYFYTSGTINYLDGNYSEAFYLLDKANKLSIENHFLNTKIYILLAKIYELNDQLEKAYQYWNLASKSSKISEKESNIVEQNLERLKKYNAQLTHINQEEIISTVQPPSEKDPLIALLKIARTVSAQTDIDVLLRTIVEITKNALEADRCTVFLLDEKNNELWSKVALGLETEEIRFPANQGLAGHVITTGETIIINDAYSDDRFNKNIDMQTGYKTKTILCLPIKNIHHEIVGVFQVLNKQNGVFDEKDEDLLIAIGASAGIALENARLFQRQQEMLKQQSMIFESFIDTLVASIDARDKSTSGHSNRVKMYSRLICDNLNLDKKTIELIEHAAILHDIGKIGIKDSVLQKEGKLTADEYAHIQQHVRITHDILSKIYLEKTEMEGVAEIASSHHEKFDGTGYHRGLKGNEIHIGGRILAVADVFDAITSHRHYRDKMPISEALSVLLNSKGTHFDPDLVDSFMSLTLDKIVRVFLSEFESQMKADDANFLKQYTLFDLYEIIKKKQKKQIVSETESSLIEMFNTYYTYKSILN